MPPSTSACTATRFESWRPSVRFPQSRTAPAASSSSGALTSTRGETVADGLAISRQRCQRWREQWRVRMTAAPLPAACAWSETSTGRRACTRSASRTEPVADRQWRNNCGPSSSRRPARPLRTWRESRIECPTSLRRCRGAVAGWAGGRSPGHDAGLLPQRGGAAPVAALRHSPSRHDLSRRSRGAHPRAPCRRAGGVNDRDRRRRRQSDLSVRRAAPCLGRNQPCLAPPALRPAKPWAEREAAVVRARRAGADDRSPPASPTGPCSRWRR